MTTYSNEVTLSDVRFARVVFACLDRDYTEDLPPMRVRLSKDEARRLVKGAPHQLMGRWDSGDDLTIIPLVNLGDERAAPPVEAKPAEGVREAVAEGWVAVPREPTDDMLDAADEPFHREIQKQTAECRKHGGRLGYGSGPVTDAVWKAMLAAAPRPTPQPGLTNCRPTLKAEAGMGKLSKRKAEVADSHRGALAELSRCALGTGAISSIMDGQSLSTLAAHGLAERLPDDPSDRVGGPRYKITALGRAALKAETQEGSHGGGEP